MQDKFLKARGELRVNIYRDGVLVEQYCENNLIVDMAKTIMANLLGGEADKNITKIGFGTSSIAPAAGDTALTGAYVKLLAAAEYPEDNSVLFPFTLGTGEANGTSIKEFGLLTEDETLFARKTRTTIEKTVDLSLSGSWKIIF